MNEKSEEKRVFLSLQLQFPAWLIHFTDDAVCRRSTIGNLSVYQFVIHKYVQPVGFHSRYWSCSADRGTWTPIRDTDTSNNISSAIKHDDDCIEVVDASALVANCLCFMYVSAAYTMNIP